MERPKNSPQLQEMLRIVGDKLGMPPEALRRQLEAGKFDQAIAGLNQQDAARFRQALANPQKLSQMLGSKQAKALYEKLTKESAGG